MKKCKISRREVEKKRERKRQENIVERRKVQQALMEQIERIYIKIEVHVVESGDTKAVIDFFQSKSNIIL